MAKLRFRTRHRLIIPCLLGVVFMAASFITWVSDKPWSLVTTRRVARDVEVFHANSRNLLLFASECDR